MLVSMRSVSVRGYLGGLLATPSPTVLFTERNVTGDKILEFVGFEQNDRITEGYSSTHYTGL